MNESILNVSSLQVDFIVNKEHLTAVHDINFEIKRGHVLAMVGESGCGKSVTATSIMRLLPKQTSRIANGDILFDGESIIKMSEKQIRNIRGNRISMIFQEPMSALNPVYTIGKQMIEMYSAHNKAPKEQIYKKCKEMLELVGIPLPMQRMNEYPFQLSGGLRQRVMIAMAMMCSPDLLIADEPTTALDVTIQAQILDQMRQLRDKQGTSILLITHDMGVVAEMADDVLVMYAGEIVESGTAEQIFDHPAHPYTMGLLKAIPRLDMDPNEELFTIDGMVPSLREFGSKCRFANRCQYANSGCSQQEVLMKEVEDGHFVRCSMYPQGGK